MNCYRLTATLLNIYNSQSIPISLNPPPPPLQQLPYDTTYFNHNVQVSLSFYAVHLSNSLKWKWKLQMKIMGNEYPKWNFTLAGRESESEVGHIILKLILSTLYVCVHVYTDECEENLWRFFQNLSRIEEKNTNKCKSKSYLERLACAHISTHAHALEM